MGFEDYDNFTQAELNNWNVAGQYAFAKILKPLIMLDEYETIARFGTSDLIAEFTVDDKTKSEARIKAIKRLTFTCILLCSNSKFALFKPEFKVDFTEYQSTLRRLEKMIEYTYDEVKDLQGKKSFRIQEEKFNKVLNKIIDIKEDISTRLNKSNLIFLNREGYNPHEVKRKIMDTVERSG